MRLDVDPASLHMLAAASDALLTCDSLSSAMAVAASDGESNSTMPQPCSDAIVDDFGLCCSSLGLVNGLFGKNKPADCLQHSTCKRMSKVICGALLSLHLGAGTLSRSVPYDISIRHCSSRGQRFCLLVST